jgi:hypothetical protein
MMIGKQYMQPADREFFDITAEDYLLAGDNVESATVTIDKVGLACTQIVIDDPRIRMWFEGGIDGETYIVTVTVTTADGRIKQVEFKIIVKET